MKRLQVLRQSNPWDDLPPRSNSNTLDKVSQDQRLQQLSCPPLGAHLPGQAGETPRISQHSLSISHGTDPELQFVLPLQIVVSVQRSSDREIDLFVNSHFEWTGLWTFLADPLLALLLSWVLYPVRQQLHIRFPMRLVCWGYHYTVIRQLTIRKNI